MSKINTALTRLYSTWAAKLLIIKDKSAPLPSRQLALRWVDNQTGTPTHPFPQTIEAMNEIAAEIESDE